MQKIGLLLILAGCVGGSLIAVLDEKVIDWGWFVPFLMVGAVGVALVQLALRRDAADVGKAEANFQALESSLTTIVKNLAALDDDKASMDVYDLPDHIDVTFRQDIFTFVEARESIAHVHGMQSYADVMSHFAAAERYLNRVWSCAADGYIDEAHTYIGRSHEQFAESLQRLTQLDSAAEAAVSAS